MTAHPPAPRGRRAQPLVAVGIAAAALLAGVGTAWAANPHLVHEADSASWDGATVHVSFREVGLDANALASISIEATGVADAVCVKNGVALFTTRSTATSSDVSDYQASADGTASGARDLKLTVGVPVVQGLDCTMEVTRTFTVMVHDRNTGATDVLNGHVASSGAVR